MASGRRATKVHSAVCPGDVDTEVEFAIDGGDKAGEPALRMEAARAEGPPKRGNRKKQVSDVAAEVVSRRAKVPCRSLDRILNAAGFPTIDILFLDVEGAEAKVLESVDLKRFSLIAMEATGYPYDGGRLSNVIEPMLKRAGFRRERMLENGKRGSWNPVYVRDDRISKQCINCGANRECRHRFLGRHGKGQGRSSPLL